jgi:membrane protein YdbS with pleckstrin-like domain
MNRLHPRAFYLFWWKYFWIFIVAFVLLGIFLLAATVIIDYISEYIIFAIVASLILSGAWARLFYNSYSFELSKQSLNIVWGVVIKHSSTIPYQRIQNIDINRGIISRMLGLSEIWVQTAGSHMGMGSFGSLRFSEGIISGLDAKSAEDFRKTLLKKIRGRSGL